MKVLFLYSYYKPEQTSGAHLAEALRKGLAEAGHTMEIYAPYPCRGVSDKVRLEYKKRKTEFDFDGAARVHRFWLYKESKHSILRAIRYSILELQLLLCGIRAVKPDIIPMESTPPINGLIGAILKKIKGVPYVYTVQDIFPDSLVNTGMAKEGSVLWRIGSWVSEITYKNAEHIVVISNNMREKLICKGVPEYKISVIYNWIDTETVVPVKREENSLFEEFKISRDKFTITYAGNLGNSQNIMILAECAKQLKRYEDIQFVIFGDGSEKNKLFDIIKEYRLKNIQLFPMQPSERVSEVYSLGHVSMITCKKGVGGSAFPSKAATIMAAETPIIASFDLDSDLCQMIQSEKVGLCAEAEDVQCAVNQILKFYNNRGICVEYGKNGRHLAETHFSKTAGVKKRIAILEKYCR